MSEREDGGAAFPVVHPDGMGVQYFGLSMRDYFASAALPALISHYSVGGKESICRAYNEISREAYWIADAMMTERAK